MKWWSVPVFMCLVMLLAAPWQPGMAQEKTEKLLWGYVNTSGKYVLKPQFEEAYTVYDGLGLVKLNGRYGYINKHGKMVIKPQFEKACDFLGGQAQVKSGSKWGFIDPSGKFIIKPTNPEFTPPLCTEVPPAFPNGLQRTQVGNMWGFKNEKGKMVIAAHYSNVFDFGDGLAPVAIPAKGSFKKGSSK